MTQETKSALLIGFIFIMIVLVVVVDGIDAGRAPAAEDAISSEVQIVPPTEDDSFQRSRPPAGGNPGTPKAKVERYTVKRGDTLSGICAEFYGDATLFLALQRANGLADSDLVPDQVITLPPRTELSTSRSEAVPTGVQVAQMPPAAQSAPVAQTEPVRKKRTYTVKSGDMLERIARKELGDGRRADEIFEMNRDQLSSPDDIKPGMVLQLPE